MITTSSVRIAPSIGCRSAVEPEVERAEVRRDDHAEDAAITTCRTIHRNSTRTTAVSSRVRMRRSSGASDRRSRVQPSLVRRRSLGADSLGTSRRSVQRLLDVGDEVVRVLDADAQAQEPVGDAERARSSP